MEISEYIYDYIYDSTMMVKILHILDYVFYIIVIVAAILGNSLVIISITKFESLRSNANYFVGSLACSDLLMACTWIVIQGL